MDIKCGTIFACDACPISLLPIQVQWPLGVVLQAAVMELPDETIRLMNRTEMEKLIAANSTNALQESLNGLHRSASEVWAIGATALRKASKKNN